LLWAQAQLHFAEVAKGSLGQMFSAAEVERLGVHVEKTGDNLAPLPALVNDPQRLEPILGVVLPAQFAEPQVRAIVQLNLGRGAFGVLHLHLGLLRDEVEFLEDELMLFNVLIALG